jgi:DNA-binding PadR family transcriptional regulator
MEHVPTLPELYAKGLAEVAEWTHSKKPKPAYYRAKPAGQKLIYEIMARNAEKGRRNDERRYAARIAPEVEGGEDLPY